MELIDADEEDAVDADDVATVARWVRERLFTFEFSDHVEKIDEAKVSFLNDDRALSDAGAFTVGQKLRVAWGWGGATSTPRQMIVVKREQNNPYVVWLRDPTVLLGQHKGGRQMTGKTDSEFVRAVLKEYQYEGTAARITATKARREITQSAKRSDAHQIWNLAKRNGFEFYIDADGAYWGPRQVDTEPKRVYEFRGGVGEGRILGEPAISQVTDRAYSIVTVVGVDPITKRAYTIEISSKDFDWASLGAEIEIADPIENEEQSKRKNRAERTEVRTVGLMPENQARELARAIYRDNAQGVYLMKLKVVGDPLLGAKCLIALQGHSIPYDGLYFVREAKHTIANGKYDLDLECDRDALAAVNAGKKVARKRAAQTVIRLADSEISVEGGTEEVTTYRCDADGEVTHAVSYVGNHDVYLPGPTETQTLDEATFMTAKMKRALAEQSKYVPLPST
jgi:phage protein D